MHSKSYTWFAAATVAIGGLTFISSSRAADDANTNTGNTATNDASNRAANAADRAGDATKNAAEKTGDALKNAADKTGDALNRAGEKIADTARNAGDKTSTAGAQAPDADDIRKTLATATEAAVTKGGIDDLAERFVDADAKRLHDFVNDNSNGKFDKLDGRIAQLQKDWKEKYGKDFSFASDRNNVLGDAFARISQGEIGEARVAGNKETASNEPKVTAGSAEDLKKSGAAKTDANSNTTGGGDTNKDAGRNIATVTIPASHGMPELAIPLIHELPDTWKIDVPDNIDGQKLHDNLLKHLTMVDEDKANWPSDVNDAYRAVTHHVMAAVMDANADSSAAGAAGAVK